MEIVKRIHQRVQESDQRALAYNRTHSAFKTPEQQLQEVASPLDAARVHAARVFNAIDYKARRLSGYKQASQDYTQNLHDIRAEAAGRAGQEVNMSYLGRFVGLAEAIGAVAAAGWFVAVLTTRLAEEGLVRATHSYPQRRAS